MAIDSTPSLLVSNIPCILSILWSLHLLFPLPGIVFFLDRCIIRSLISFRSLCRGQFGGLSWLPYLKFHSPPVVGEVQARPIAVLLNHWSTPQWASPLPILCIKGDRIRTEGGWFFETLVCHLLGLLALQLKSLFLARTICLPFYWPVLQGAE